MFCSPPPLNWAVHCNWVRSFSLCLAAGAAGGAVLPLLGAVRRPRGLGRGRHGRPPPAPPPGGPAAGGGGHSARAGTVPPAAAHRAGGGGGARRDPAPTTRAGVSAVPVQGHVSAGGGGGSGRPRRARWRPLLHAPAAILHGEEDPAREPGGRGSGERLQRDGAWNPA